MNQSAFAIACKYGHLDDVRTMCKERRLWDTKRIDLQEGFQIACLNGQLDVIQFLIQHGVQDDGRGIETACACGYQEAFELLLNLKKRPICISEEIERRDILIDNENYSVPFNYICRAIRGACKRGDVNFFNFVLRRTLRDGDKQDDRILEYMGNAFIQACIAGTLDTVKMIHASFANYVEAYHYGEGFAEACENGHSEIVEFFASHDPYDYVDWFNGLSFACQNGHADIVYRYIDRINNINHHDFDHLLTDACFGDDDALVKFLIERGATNFNGGLNAALCASVPTDKIVALLIERGATGLSYAFFVDWHFYDDGDDFAPIADMILKRILPDRENILSTLTNSEKIDLYVNAVGVNVIIENLHRALTDDNNCVVELILNHFVEKKWTLPQEVLDTLLLELSVDSSDDYKSVVLLLIKMGAKQYTNIFYEACKNTDLEMTRTLIHHFPTIPQSVIDNALEHVLGRDRFHNNLVNVDPRKFQLIAYLLYVGAKFPQYFYADELVPPLTNRRLLPITKKRSLLVDENVEMVRQRASTQHATYNVMDRFTCEDVIIFMCVFAGVPHFTRKQVIVE